MCGGGSAVSEACTASITVHVTDGAARERHDVPAAGHARGRPIKQRVQRVFAA